MLILSGVSLVATLIWTAAMVTAAYALFRGRMPGLAEMYSVALRRAGPLLLSILMVALASMVLAAAATVLFAVTLFGTLGSLAALIGLIYWWRVPRGRTPVLKWLIILTAPYGLLVYYLTCWSLIVPVSVVERRGPIDALLRSARLVSGQWFRTGAVLAVLSAILFVVGTMPAYIVILLFELLGLAGSPFAPSMVRAFVTNVVSILVQIPVGAIGFLGYTLLFVDLRNRREGTDLAERITALETATAQPVRRLSRCKKTRRSSGCKPSSLDPSSSQRSRLRGGMGLWPSSCSRSSPPGPGCGRRSRARPAGARAGSAWP